VNYGVSCLLRGGVLVPVVYRAGAPPSRFLWFLAALLCERRVTRFLARAPFGFCLSAFILFSARVFSAICVCFVLFALFCCG
jgi:hypothetical protein